MIEPQTPTELRAVAADTADQAIREALYFRADKLEGKPGTQGYKAPPFNEDPPDGEAWERYQAELAKTNGSRPKTAGGWPELDRAALHGLAGQVVAAISPHSEADEAGLLFAFLAEVGAIIGPGPHALADSAQHPARLFVNLVGQTAKGRKGSTEANIRRFSAVIDPRFARDRRLNGFGSGESLVDAVRGDDESTERRLLIIEPEFARVLNVATRDGSVLSPIIRAAWDGERLAVRSRARTTVVDGAHIAVVAHISADELRSKLTDTEVAAGFANRFLFVCVRRSKLLPDGGNLDDAVVADLSRKVAFVVMQCRKVGILKRTPEAAELWCDLYRQMDQDEPGGLLGAIVARDSAQVLRLSVTYALLDGKNRIDVEHIRAAWAAWTYCRASAAYVFGESLGDVIADTLLRALRSAGKAGMNGTAQRDLFSRNATRAQLDNARELLISRGLAISQSVETGGRPQMVLRATEYDINDKRPLTGKSPPVIGDSSNDINDLTTKAPDDPGPTDSDFDRWFGEEES